MAAELETVDEEVVEGEVIDDDAAVADAIAYAELMLAGLALLAEVLERRGALQLARAIRFGLGRGEAA